MLQSAHALMQRSGKAVLVTSTTHLGNDQVALGDRHFVVTSQLELEHIVRDSIPGVIILTGEQDDQSRLRGLPGDLLWRLKDLAEELSLALLIEADGSRLHPLKAPA